MTKEQAESMERALAHHNRTTDRPDYVAVGVPRRSYRVVAVGDGYGVEHINAGHATGNVETEYRDYLHGAGQ